MNRNPATCCHRCEDAAVSAGAITCSVMILCPTCGNKRCPKATDHRFDCTGSNEPGQLGSIYSDWLGLGAVVQ